MTSKQNMRVMHSSVSCWKTELCYYAWHRYIFNHCDVVGLQSYRIRWNNAKSGLLRRSRSFKVTDVDTNRKPVCDFILVMNTITTDILSRTDSKLSHFNYCLNFGHCSFTKNGVSRFLDPFGRLGATYDMAHCKACSGLPIIVDWTFFASRYG